MGSGGAGEGGGAGVKLLGTAFWLMVSNFAWQAVTDQNWMVATERSYFQASALAIYAIVTLRGP